MKIRRYLILLALLALTSLSAVAQSLTIKRDLQMVQYSSVLAQYKNEFGRWEKPDLDDTFPYAVIRVGLEGDGRSVREAKRLLGLYMGTQTAVEDMYKGGENEILFLVPARTRHIEITCGDGCSRQVIYDGNRLQSNTVYYCRVHFIPEEIVETGYQGPKVYPFHLRVEPKDAKVEVIAHGERKDWILTGGMADLQLTEGEYRYTIVAKNHYTAEGLIRIPSANTDTLIRLVPKYGWLSVEADSIILGDSMLIRTASTKMRMALPVERMQCDSGAYILRIKKPKYRTWQDTVYVQHGVESKISPVLQAKEPKQNTYVMLQAGYALNPNWSAGLMVGQTLGDNCNKVGAGWYVQARSNFQFQQNTSGLVAGEGGKVDGDLMYYTGKKTSSMWMVNAGLLLNFLHAKVGNNAFGLYLGAGYGKYSSLWEMTNGEWVEYGPSSAMGVSCGAGLVGSIKGITLSVGANTIGMKYLEITAGLGWTF